MKQLVSRCTSWFAGAGMCVALTLAVLIPGLALAGSYDDYFRAIKIDNAPVVQNLLAQGFDPNTIEPQRGDSGLILALREESMSVFRTLLDAPEIDIHARAFNGDTALMIAAFKGNRVAVDALIARGAEVQHPGWTPLHYAAMGGHNDIVKLLLDRGAQLDARSPNNTTPVMMAAWGGKIYTVKLLLDVGADAMLKNDHGMNAIDFALHGGYQDIADGLTWRLRKAGKLPLPSR